jgi:hypothetical protein
MSENAAWSLAARAQRTDKVPVVGFFYPGPKPAAASRIKAFLAGLRSGGFSGPEKVTLALEITDGDASLLAPMAAGVFLDFPDFSKKWLEMLKETVPQVSAIAVLWDRGPPAPN